MKKVCLIASSGGHYEQLLMLKELAKTHDVYYVTEKMDYSIKQDNVYFVKQVNRQEKLLLLNMLIVFIQSLIVFIKERPDVIISTGSLSVIPTFLIGKLFRKKLIFIESFAKVKTPTATGKLLSKIANKVIVQWPDMLEVYPNAEYWGSIY